MLTEPYLRITTVKSLMLSPTYLLKHNQQTSYGKVHDVRLSTFLCV